MESSNQGTASGLVITEEELADEELGIEDATPIAITAKLCSLLFVAPKPLTAEVLAEAAREDIEETEAALLEIQGFFSDDVHGFSLEEVMGGYQFRTAPSVASTLKRLIPARAKRLSRAAAETLAVIAYKQPVQRAEIEAIRGVDALPTLKTLLDAKLVRIIGREDTVGQPALYGTTPAFLEKFGLNDLSELPSIREIEELSTEPGEGSEIIEVDESSESDDEFAEETQNLN